MDQGNRDSSPNLVTQSHTLAMPLPSLCLGFLLCSKGQEEVGRWDLQHLLVLLLSFPRWA